MQNEYQCLAGNDPEENFKDYFLTAEIHRKPACMPENCWKCGFNPDVAAYRMQVLAKNGFTIDENGIANLKLPRLGVPIKGVDEDD